MTESASKNPHKTLTRHARASITRTRARWQGRGAKKRRRCRGSRQTTSAGARTIRARTDARAATTHRTDADPGAGLTAAAVATLAAAGMSGAAGTSAAEALL